MLVMIHDLFAAANLTATAGTVINSLMPARKRLKSWIGKLAYAAGTTAHTLTVMKPLAPVVQLAANAASGQAVIVLTKDPGAAISDAVAANDYLVLEQNDGTNILVQVSSVSAGTGTQINVTLTANLSQALNKNNFVWFMGVAGDGHPQYTAGASVTTTLGSDNTVLGVAGADRTGEPVVVQSNNATAAGTFVQIQGAYLATNAAV